MSSVVWTLIDNGKLANQIARLAAIVVKYKIELTLKVTDSLTEGLSLFYFPQMW